MSVSDLWLPAFAVLLAAPFAVTGGYVVRDGRELRSSGLLLIAGSVVAALVGGYTGSLLLAVPAAFAVVLALAFVRLRAAQMAAAPPPVPVSVPVPAPASAAALPVAAPAPPAPPPSLAAAPDPLPPDPGVPPVNLLLAGMAFVGEILETADHIGELRHRRRLRKLERLRAERQAGVTRPSHPQRSLQVRVRRDPVKLLPWR